MRSLSVRGIVRELLTAEPTLSVEDVARRARAKGLRAPDKAIQKSVYNVRSELAREGRGKPATLPAAEPVPAAATPASDLATMLANVALVNAVVGGSGGVDAARQVAEAVRACGGVDLFLQHLDLVGGIRDAGGSK